MKARRPRARTPGVALFFAGTDEPAAPGQSMGSNPMLREDPGSSSTPERARRARSGPRANETTHENPTTLFRRLQEIDMTTRPGRKVFISLAVQNVEKSKEFFTKLGFEFNLKFTDEKAASMILNEDAYMMLLSRPFFESLATKALCDTTTHNEAAFGIHCESRAGVDELLRKAIAAGGKRAGEPQDHGFMYAQSFYDLDDHHWEIVWMDPAMAAA